MHPDLPELLADIHRRGGTFEELSRGAIERGVPLEEVVGRVECLHDFWDDRDSAGEGMSTFLLEGEEEYWLDTLCAVTGGDEAAQAVVDRASGWMTEVTVRSGGGREAVPVPLGGGPRARHGDRAVAARYVDTVGLASTGPPT
ncbi:MAG: hypothetical protein V4850_10665 [Myxococcota bacterium]